jgi:hypothetical protein
VLPIALVCSSLALAQFEPPPGLEAGLRIGGGTAVPGGTVTLPLIVHPSSATPDHDFQGFSYSVDFDEEVLEFVGYERRYQRPDGRNWGFAALKVNGGNDTQGNAGLDEGYLVGGVIFCHGPDEPNDPCPPGVMPPLDADNEMLGLTFRVKEDVPPGSTEIRFLDGAQAYPGGPPIANVVVIGLYEAALRFEVAAVVVNGLLAIVADPGEGRFIRGDANDDLAVDLSDAVFTLNHLFLGDRPPRCRDAADANDDGHLDIGDPVATLEALFRGGSIPSPSEAPGEDPTPEDPLDCAGV